MFLELFLFAKNMQFLTKGGIHCISRSSLGPFILCAGTHWSNRRSMMTVLLILSYLVCRAIHTCYTYMHCCIHSTSCLPIMNGRRRGTREEFRKQALSFSLEYGDEQADARWDHRTRLARPNCQARTTTAKK